MVRIKMCGITTPIDAAAAADAGASSIGIVAFDSSPRFIPPSKVSEIRRALPPWVSITVVAPDIAIASQYDVDVFQVYSMPTSPTSKKIIHAIRASTDIDVDGLLGNTGIASALLFDAYHPQLMGGSGHRINESLAVKLFTKDCSLPRILAGGLTPDNVETAISMLTPWGVDVSSGIEISPGEKCHSKMQAFVNAVQRADFYRQE